MIKYVHFSIVIATRMCVTVVVDKKLYTFTINSYLSFREHH